MFYIKLLLNLDNINGINNTNDTGGDIGMVNGDVQENATLHEEEAMEEGNLILVNCNVLIFH